MVRSRTAAELAHRVGRYDATATQKGQARGPAAPWRHRQQRVKRKELPQEKKARQEKIDDNKKEYQEFLDNCSDHNWDKAVEAHARWPQHSPEYHYSNIMSFQRKSVKTREPNIWNAYQRQELKKVNEGELFIFSEISRFLTTTSFPPIAITPAFNPPPFSSTTYSTPSRCTAP